MSDLLQAFARARGGVFTTTEAISCGHTPSQIRTRVRRGEWRCLRRGFYCFAVGPLAPGSERDEHRVQTIAVLASTDGAAASHRTAASLYNLPLLGTPDARTHATFDPSRMRTPSYRRDVNLHAAQLVPGDTWLRDGLLITRPARTIVDFARWVDLVSGVAATDAALHAGLVTAGDLAHVLAAQRGWPMIGRAAAALRLADAAAESPLESFGRVVLLRGGVRDLVSQVTVQDERGFVGRADFGVRGTRCLIEADGLMKYDAPEVLRNEKLRQERLERAGYVVVRFTWADLERRPDDVVSRVRAAAAQPFTGQGDRWWTRPTFLHPSNHNFTLPNALAERRLQG